MTTAIYSHKDLEVWKKSISLVREIYSVTKIFPSEERFGITQQMRRSAISVQSNIAEGSGRNSKKEFIQFLSIAQGSLAELETQIIISRELNYISGADSFDSQIKLIRIMIKRLSEKLSNTP